MRSDEMSRPTVEREGEARRLGWRQDCPVTWREFLEQYPYGLAEIRGAARRMLDAA